MVRRIVLILVLSIAGSAAAQSAWLQDLPNPHDYILKRSSSYDRTGGNADARPLAPGSALTVLDEAGPGVTQWTKGQRVGVGWHGGQDGTCLACRRGDFANCANLKISGISYDGGYH